MPCNKCEGKRDIEDLSAPYVIRICSKCGREIKLREAITPGIGIGKIQKGDRPVFPDGWFKFSVNPLKGMGHLSKSGVEWFAKLTFVADLPQKLESFDQVIEENDRCSVERRKSSELTKEFDLENPEQNEMTFQRLYANQHTVDWWNFVFGTFNAVAAKAIEENDARKAAWAMACAERARSMIVFKEYFEDVVWMGHSAKRLVEVIGAWDTNKQNGEEQFWQKLFNDNPYMISQLFSVPVVFINERAYVGGMNVDNKDAKLLDYLYRTETAKDAILIEIKTPRTKLLGGRYRKGVYGPSSEMAGASVQILDYRRQLGRSFKEVTDGTPHKLDIFNPRCVIIAGNAEEELTNDLKRKSFELYRRNLRDVEIVTYDEMFNKAETLATLFNIVRKE
jgi:Shedu protein SduA, C-terminal